MDDLGARIMDLRYGFRRKLRMVAMEYSAGSGERKINQRGGVAEKGKWGMWR